MLNIIKNTINRVFASGVDSDASAFITATGLSGTTQKSAITTLVKDLKSSGLWNKMKAVYPMVTDNYNQFYYSEDFSNANWYRINNTITTNSTIAPNGTLTGDTFTDNATNNFHEIAANYTLTGINGNNTASIYAKANTLNWICVTYYISGTFQKTFFDLQNGLVGTNASGNTATIENVGNGWYRCSITRNFNATGSFNVGFHTASADNVDSYAGSGQSLYIWGAQFQAGTPLAYQPILTSPSAFMASQMKYNLKDARDLDAAFRLTWSGGWTYSATGATPNGTNGYIDTNLVGNTNISQGNFGFGIYSRTNSSTVGAYGINGALHIYPKFTDGNTYYRIFGGGSAVSGQTTLGLIYGFNDSTSTSYGWFNGVKKQTTPSSNYTIPSTNLMFAGNVTGTGGYDSRQLSFGFASLYLNDSEAQLLNQIVEKYQVALSRGVQAAQSFYYNSAYSNEANTYLYSTQITGTTQVSAINTLINGLKANNLWTKMKAVYPFVTDYRNLLAYTEDFTNAVWTNNNLTISANSTNSPINTLTADTLTPTTSNVLHFVQNAIVCSAGNQVLSVYAKSNGYNFVAIGENNGTAWAYFNLSNGTVGNTNNAVSTSIENVGNGWYRCSLTYASSGGTKGAFILCDSVNGNLSAFAGNGTNGIYLWGAQLELGATASAYQPVLGVNNYAANVAAQMKFNLVNPQDSDAAFRLAFSGGWTYSTNGAQPNGTNGYADTKLNANNNLNINSTHISYYSRTDNSSTLYFDIGANDATAGLHICPKFSNVFYPRVFDNNSGIANTTNTLGLFIANRQSSSIIKAQKGNTLTSITSSTVNNISYNIYLGALNSTNTPLYFSPRQAAFASIGDGLSDAEALTLYNLIQQFQTDLSRQV